MRIIYLPKKIYKLYDYARSHNVWHEYREKYGKVVDDYTYYRKEYGVSHCDLQKQFGISRATYYRRKKVLKALDSGVFVEPFSKPHSASLRKWGEAEISLVRKIRNENPTYGKNKIYHILKREHDFTMSESTVGRILKHLMDRRLIEKSISAQRKKKRRKFDKHAQKFTFKKYEDMVLGERVQVDHMTVTKNGRTYKHFQAWERKSKVLIAQIYSRARSKDAAKFLKELVKKAPYKILSIQVDGGSEFMKEFEEACEDLGIELFVLPPASPKYNGGVERANRILREEFYENPKLLADSIENMRYELQKMLKKYNEYRPHSALLGLTPLMYINNYHEANKQSQSI